MKLKVAKLSDIGEVLKLQNKYHVDSINEEDKKDGFVTTAFTKKQLTDLVNKEQGLFIGLKNNHVVAYLMSASWEYWSQWLLFEHMIKELGNVKYLGMALDTNNSYQYGPVCLDKSIRGSGALELIFDFAREKMSKKYPILVTFVNVANRRSYVAHIKKLGLTEVNKFEFNKNQYSELVYNTSKELKSVVKQ